MGLQKCLGMHINQNYKCVKSYIEIGIYYNHYNIQQYNTLQYTCSFFCINQIQYHQALPVVKLKSYSSQNYMFSSCAHCLCNALIPLTIHTPPILKSSLKGGSLSTQTVSSSHHVTCHFTFFHFCSGSHSSTTAALLKE